MNAPAMIDRFGGDWDEPLPELAMAATEDKTSEIDCEKTDPSKHKGMFETPERFEKAWNHPEPFQRRKWREGISKEFTKMENNEVWQEFKRSDVPHGRRCVKHKWALEIKRSGIFRCQLVACGHSQMAGVDFAHVFSPVCIDVSF